VGELQQSDPLTVNLGAPDAETIVMHPNEGRKFDCWETTKDFNFYLDMDEFIHASDECREITLDQQNDCDKGVIVIKNSLKKELDNPESLVVFRKNDNVFLKTA